MTHPSVRTGLDQLVEAGFRPLHGRRVGLVTNPTGVDRELRHLATLLAACSAVDLRVLFAPEHGIWGTAQDQVAVPGEPDPVTGRPVISLYGSTQADLAPPPGSLDDIDVLVFDVQDIGARYYTFVWTLTHCMEAASRAGRSVMVLDRPNPLAGTAVQGNVQDPAFCSFVGRYPVAARHALTVAEIARFVRGEFGLGGELEVVPLAGWSRRLWYDETGLPWIAPSPNMPTLDTASVYPGMCLLEGTNLSEGRGTTRPFELFGAPFIDPHRLARELNALDLPGIRFRPLWFRPTFHKWQGQDCGGAQLHVLDRQAFDPFAAGLAVVSTVQRLWPDRFRFADPPYELETVRLPFDLLAGTDAIRQAILAGATVADLRASFAADAPGFLERCRPYWLYPAE